MDEPMLTPASKLSFRVTTADIVKRKTPHFFYFRIATADIKLISAIMAIAGNNQLIVLAVSAISGGRVGGLR